MYEKIYVYMYTQDLGALIYPCMGCFPARLQIIKFAISLGLSPAALKAIAMLLRAPQLSTSLRSLVCSYN